MGKRIEAQDIISAEVKKVIEELTGKVSDLNKEVGVLTKTVVSAKKEFDNQSKSQDDLKRKTEGLNAVEKELQRIEKAGEKINKDTILASERLKQKRRELTEQVRRENKELQQNQTFTQKMTGAVKGGIAQFGLWLGAITGVTVVLKKFLTGVKDSAQFMSDQWNVTIEQGRTALETFQKALASPNGFRNFFSNLKESLSEIRKYVKELDELGELNRELRIQEQKARQSLAEQAKIFRSSTASVDEKIAATEKYIQIQRDLADTKEKLTKRAYENEISNLIKGTQLTREQAKAYIENYSALDPLVKKAIDFLETQRDLQPVAFTLNPIKGWSNAISGAMNLISGETSKEAERLKELAKSFDNTGKAGEDAFKQAAAYLSFSEEAMNKTGAAAEAYFGSLGQFDEKTLRAQLAQDRAIESVKNGMDELTKEELADIELTKQRQKEKQDLIANGISENLIQSKSANEIKLLDEALYTEESLKLFFDYIEKRKNAGKELSDFEIELKQYTENAKAQLEEEIYNSAQKIASDNFNAKIDEDLARFRDSQQAEEDILKNRLDKGLISEKEYNKKLKALNLKTRQEESKAEKKKARFSNILDTLVAVTKTFAQFGWPHGIIPAAIMGGIGLAKGIAIEAEPIPKYFKGGTKQGDGPAIIGDKPGAKGQHEFVMLPNGEGFISNNYPTILNLPHGTKIYPEHTPETQRALKSDNGESLKYLKSIDNKLSGRGGTPLLTKGGLEYYNERTNTRVKQLKRWFS